MSYAADQFPEYIDGDVLIVSPTGTKSWKLHSTMLRNHSAVFYQMLESTEPRRLSKALLEQGETIIWKFRMVPDVDNRFVNFIPVNLSQPQLPNMPMQLAGGEPLFHRTYDMFFRFLYNLNVQFNHSPDGSADVYDCVTMLTLSERLGATAVVRASMETILLRLGTALWNQVLRCPDAWAEIGIRVRSPVILREAVVHLVGAWSFPGAFNKENLSNIHNGEIIKQIVEQKVEELKKKKIEVEGILLNFFPPSMIHFTHNGKIPNRHVYAGDVYRWQSLTILRQFYVEQLRDSKGHLAEDGGVAFYRAIGQGRNAYLDQLRLDSFFANCVMSNKGENVLRTVLGDLMEEFKHVVADLMKDNTHCSDELQAQIPYLTCTEFKNEEMPWNTRPEEYVDN